MERARRLCEIALAIPKPVVSFSGGKDSIVVAHLARAIKPDVPLVYQDTGMADPRLTEVVQRYGGKHLVHLPPARDPTETWRAENCLPIGAKTSSINYRRKNPALPIGGAKCCQFHKGEPLDRWNRAHGTTADLIGAKGSDSHRHRFKLTTGEIFPKARCNWVICYPILCWTRDDVHAYLRAHVPDYPLLYSTAEELGCRACAVDLAFYPNQLSKLRMAEPDYHLALLRDHRYGETILAMRYGLSLAGARALIAREGLESLAARGAFDQIPQPKKTGIG